MADEETNYRAIFNRNKIDLSIRLCGIRSRALPCSRLENAFAKLERFQHRFDVSSMIDEQSESVKTLNVWNGRYFPVVQKNLIRLRSRA
jgi:hypothetical protein